MKVICEKIGDFRVSSLVRVMIFKYPLKNTICVQINYKLLGRNKIKFFWTEY